jgi:hypothetical protein
MPSQPQLPPSTAAAARLAQRLRTAVSAGQWDMLAAILRVLPAEQVPLALRAAADWASATGSQRAAQPAPAAQAPAAGVPVSSAATATRRRGCRGGRGRKQQPTVVAAGPPAAPAERAPSPPGQGRAMEVEELCWRWACYPAACAPVSRNGAEGGLRQDQPTDSGMGGLQLLLLRPPISGLLRPCQPQHHRSQGFALASFGSSGRASGSSCSPRVHHGSPSHQRRASMSAHAPGLFSGALGGFLCSLVMAGRVVGGEGTPFEHCAWCLRAGASFAQLQPGLQ